MIKVTIYKNSVVIGRVALGSWDYPIETDLDCLKRGVDNWVLANFYKQANIMFNPNSALAVMWMGNRGKIVSRDRFGEHVIGFTSIEPVKTEEDHKIASLVSQIRLKLTSVNLCWTSCPKCKGTRDRLADLEVRAENYLSITKDKPLLIEKLSSCLNDLNNQLHILNETIHKIHNKEAS